MAANPFKRVALLLLTGFAIAIGFDEGFAQQQAVNRFAERFRALDVDESGALSAEELGRTAEVFKAMDSDGDGGVTLAEAQAFFRERLGNARPQRPAPGSDPVEFPGEFADEMPVTLASCRAAADYSANANGHAVLVMVDGKTVYERYDNGWDHKTPHRLASGTKSFAGVAAAAAVHDELLSLDEKVSATITEWKEDPDLEKITMRQLLSLTSGIDPGENSRVLPYAEAIQVKAKHDPGTRFDYGPNPFQIFGEVMRRKLLDKEETALDYLKRRVLDPIGMKTGQWRMTTGGYPHMPSGAFVTAREWAKFGEFLRRGGKWKGEKLVRKELLDELLAGSKANPAYGITFWLSREGGAGAGGDRASRSTTPSLGGTKHSDLYMAAGAGKQRLYVIPSQKLVVVRFGETQGRRYLDNAFLGKLLETGGAEPEEVKP